MLIETIPILHGTTTHVELHEARMRRAAIQLGMRTITWTETWTRVSEHLQHEGLSDSEKCLRCTIVYADRIAEVRTVPYKVREVNTLRLFRVPDDYDYSLKSEDRSLFTPYSRQCAPGEEALFVRAGQLTDTTYTNVVVEYDDGRLLTPESPLLEGTERMYLLQSGMISTSPLTPEDLSTCKQVHLINAMMPLRTLTVQQFIL